MGMPFGQGLVTVPFGRARRGPPPAHRATTVELRTLYPFVVPDDLGVDGCYIGREASGASSASTPGSATPRCLDEPQRRRVRPDRPGQVGLREVVHLAAAVWAPLLGTRP